MKNDYEIMSRFVLHYDFNKLKNQAEVKQFIDDKIVDYNIDNLTDNELKNVKQDLFIWICQNLF